VCVCVYVCVCVCVRACACAQEVVVRHDGTLPTEAREFLRVLSMNTTELTAAVAAAAVALPSQHESGAGDDGSSRCSASDSACGVHHHVNDSCGHAHSHAHSGSRPCSDFGTHAPASPSPSLSESEGLGGRIASNYRAIVSALR
jgi:hypothetical protein